MPYLYRPSHPLGGTQSLEEYLSVSLRHRCHARRQDIASEAILTTRGCQNKIHRAWLFEAVCLVVVPQTLLKVDSP